MPTANNGCRALAWLDALPPLVFAGLIVCLLGSCSARDVVVERNIVALGTVVSITAHAPPAHFETTVSALVTPKLAQLESQWRSFGTGELGLANDQLEQGQCGQISAATKRLIESALYYRQLTQGFFDPTLGLVVDQWGFRDAQQQTSDATLKAMQSHTAAKNPPASHNHRAQAQIRWRESDSKNSDRSWSICSDVPTRIDLGGIAKGQIVAELAKILDQAGIHNTLISAGGDIQVSGSRGDSAWRIAIQHPRAASVITTLEASPGDVLFSSGDYHRFKLIDGKRAHHIIDPRTDAPANGSMAVTVVHHEPVRADVAATALFVAGPLYFNDIAKALNIERAILVDSQMNVHTVGQWTPPLPKKLR